ncbi:hypothetical protein PCH_Pc21g16400 [Penicillium rubens Wisconsin 54-1255]|uniref:Uncharacterized protein n=1 Tax=Penicillium rubens (strain ATCC 28089 / DSM 1075 / NRRL 1951 / Wisconsin 54-1255) TaxID=500485 RepID=B6HKZ8_PENRW|nr:hypothetical protein PCH_Pc21g16400 [Penicillium rubens Wisconsin 54-1255]
MAPQTGDLHILGKIQAEETANRRRQPRAQRPVLHPSVPKVQSRLQPGSLSQPAGVNSARSNGYCSQHRGRHTVQDSSHGLSDYILPKKRQIANPVSIRVCDLPYKTSRSTRLRRGLLVDNRRRDKYGRNRRSNKSISRKRPMSRGCGFLNIWIWMLMSAKDAIPGFLMACSPSNPYAEDYKVKLVDDCAAAVHAAYCPDIGQHEALARNASHLVGSLHGQYLPGGESDSNGEWCC